MWSASRLLSRSTTTTAAAVAAVRNGTIYKHTKIGSSTTTSGCRARSSLSEALRHIMWSPPSGAVVSSSTPEPRTAWQPEHNIDIQRVTLTAIIHDLTLQQIQTIERIVPWYLKNMPASYFRQVPETFRMDHMKAISAVKDANMDLHLNLQTPLPDGRQVWTMIRPGTEPGLLSSMVAELPPSSEENPLSRIHVFSTEDTTMSLNMFVFGKEQLASPANLEVAGARILQFAQEMQEGLYANDNQAIKNLPEFSKERILEYMANCSEVYIRGSDPQRFLSQMEQFNEVSGTEDMTVRIDDAVVDELERHHYWIDIAVANSMPQVALENAAHLLYLHRFDIDSAHLDVVQDGENGNVTLLRLLVAPIEGKAPSEETLDLLERELKRTKWLDPTTMDLVFDRYPWLGVTRGEIITALCCLMHPVMAKLNAMAFSKTNILQSVTRERYIPLAAAIADLFLDRFSPDDPLSNQELEQKSNELRAKIDRDVEDSTANELLNKMIDIVGYTLKTNVYMTGRYSLGLRLDPAVMEHDGENREHPYGILFAHGRRFTGYHVRFRDIARGGLRLVTPATAEGHALESARQYDECYGLALAQQLKNKDIPEGGAKAVILVETNNLPATYRNFVLRKSVKAFTDTVLDLIVDTEETRANVVDLFGKKEVLYLGPDEQVIPEDINWIVKRAETRGYSIPNAFMSSKPRAGINHKVYGVTSEGVNVYLDVALRQMGIDPTKDPFTIKMTGGPDGDVAGNEIKILYREYGTNARVVGIADQSGCAEDPHGLNYEELLRLVEHNLCISHFDKSRLSPTGSLHIVDTEEGVVARNSMHNRVKADAFIPAGGRPNTLDINNYRHFLLPDGTPSSPLIVEAANLFLTADAREALYREAGVRIVKDSSANKCGVITSSFEICAAMLLTEDEFFDNKTAIVDEVLQRLRDLAAMEAKLLFREFDNYPGSLPQISQSISNTINMATDALAAALDTLSEEDLDTLLPLFRAHLPKTISDIAFDRVKKNVPEQYIKNAIASCLASKLVYKEGTKFIEAQPKHKLSHVALEYIAKEKEIALLKESLVNAVMADTDKEAILKLLDAGGARTALNVF